MENSSEYVWSLFPRSACVLRYLSNDILSVYLDEFSKKWPCHPQIQKLAIGQVFPVNRSGSRLDIEQKLIGYKKISWMSFP